MICSILIVDDEKSIAEGLRILIERYVESCSVAGIACDGEEGCEQALTLQPDLVLTDIRMPQMDGITMISELKKAGFQGRFIILSGYAEFEYAKSAVSLGVEEYITKPVEEEELQQVLKRACQAVEEEWSQKQRVLKMEDELKSVSQSVKNYEIKAFLEGNGSREAGECLEMMDFPLKGGQYGCILFEAAEEGDLAEALHEMIVKQTDSVGKYFLLPWSGRQCVLLISCGREVTGRSYIMWIEKLRFLTAQRMGFSICAGAGALHSRPAQLSDSLEEAKCALNYQVIKGPDCVISYTQIMQFEGRPDIVAQEDIRRLENCIDNMDDEGCHAVVDDIFRKIEKEKRLGLEDLQLLSLNLLLTGVRKVPFTQLRINEYLGKNILSLESISKFKTTKQLENWIINTLKGMNELMLKESLPQKRDVVEEAKEYINRHFQEEISMKELAEQFYLNPYYFSQLFKKKTGETYQNYLTTVRVNRAKKLLKETDLKVYEICNLVGYQDMGHFNRVFERQAGVRPGEYRKEK